MATAAHHLGRLRKAARALALPEFPHHGGGATRWLAAAFLVFLFFFLFQAHYPPQAYSPYTHSVWVSPAWRNILAATLFLGLLAGLLRPPLALRVMHWWVVGMCVAAVLYFGLIVSNRPEMMEINDRSQALQMAVGKLLAGEFPNLPPPTA